MEPLYLPKEARYMGTGPFAGQPDVSRWHWAVKVLKVNPTTRKGALRGFVQEATILSQLRHPAICTLLGTCVQTQKLDETARTARDLFLSLYTPKRPLAVVDCEADAVAFLAKFSRRAE